MLPFLLQHIWFQCVTYGSKMLLASNALEPNNLSQCLQALCLFQEFSLEMLQIAAGHIARPMERSRRRDAGATSAGLKVATISIV